MLFFALPVWGVLCTFCIIALFVQIASFTRIFFITRKPFTHYISLLFPLAVCVQATIILLYAQNVPPLNLGIHVTYQYYEMVKHAVDRGIMLCQWQVALLIIVFIAMFVIERRFLPHVKQPPAWVNARMMQMMR